MTAERDSVWKTALAGLFVAALMVWYALIPSAQQLEQSWNNPTIPTWSVPLGDVDTILIHGGLVRHPHFLDTLSWFRGSWVAGDEIPFYRPIPSLAFWCEWKLFGDFEGGYILFNLIMHLLVAVQLFRVTRSLLRYLRCKPERLGSCMACLVLFTGLYGLDPARQASNNLILSQWKNLPDPLCAFFLLTSLGAYLRAIEQDNKRRLVLAVLWYWLACASKESGSLLPLAFCLLERKDVRRRSPAGHTSSLWRIAVWIGAMLAFQAMRMLMLQGIGYRYGSNSAWPLRLLSGFAIPFGPLIVLRNWLPLLTFAIIWIATGTARPIWGKLKSRAAQWVYVALWPMLLVLLAGKLLLKVETGDTWLLLFAASVLLVLEQSWGIVAILCLFPMILEQASRANILLVLFGYAWVAVTLLPNMLSPGPVHRDYIVGLGFCFVFGYGFARLLTSAQVIRSRILSRCVQPVCR
jgi:hypothetical protein